MLYVPNAEDYKCVIIRDSSTIRAYKETPTNNSTINYDDYYFNANYIKQNGQQTFSQYTTLPTCINSSELTSEYYYRNDIADICFVILFLSIILMIPFKILFRMFRRFN